jgi:hypothetical protein
MESARHASPGGIEVLVRHRPTASRLAALPALIVLALSIAVGLAGREARTVVECAGLFGVTLVQTFRPSLLGWAVALVWFTFSTIGTISLALGPGSDLRVLPILLFLVPAAVLLAFRPRAESNERGAPMVALLLGVVIVAPLFIF